MAMATITTTVADICADAKRAAKALARADTATKNTALERIATALEERTEEILEANARDMQAGREAELGGALLDRLLLDEGRIEGIAKAVRQIVALGDPVGEVIDGHRLPNGLDVRKVITHRLPARDFLEGFETMRTGKSGKIVLDWTQI